MIQDISPDRLDNAWRDLAPGPEDFVLVFTPTGDLAVASGDQGLVFPRHRDISGLHRCVYLFSVSGMAYFLALDAEESAVPDAYGVHSLRALRDQGLRSNTDLFIVYTAYHLWQWYVSSRYCGACGAETVFDHEERAKVCPRCGNHIYPRINPAVIVGVLNGDRILVTRYNRGFAHNALIAGFTEIGETAEDTVRREVMEEAGLRVKNIRYFGSQPWGVAADLLLGFYCDVDGDDTIRMDAKELKYAQWVARRDLVLQPTDYSLTNEMMKRFRDGTVPC